MAGKNGSNGHTRAPCDGDAADLARQLELSSAVADAALTSVDELERVVRKLGGYLEYEDQAALVKATALLEHHGRRKPKARSTWKDRT